MLTLNIQTISFHDQLDKKEILNIFPLLIQSYKRLLLEVLVTATIEENKQNLKKKKKKIGKNEMMSFAGTWMGLEIIILNEES